MPRISNGNVDDANISRYISPAWNHDRKTGQRISKLSMTSVGQVAKNIGRILLVKINRIGHAILNRGEWINNDRGEWINNEKIANIASIHLLKENISKRTGKLEAGAQLEEALTFKAMDSSFKRINQVFETINQTSDFQKIPECLGFTAMETDLARLHTLEKEVVKKSTAVEPLKKLKEDQMSADAAGIAPPLKLVPEKPFKQMALRVLENYWNFSGAPRTLDEAKRILERMGEHGCKKGFYLVPSDSDSSFKLCIMTGNEIQSKDLVVKDDGGCEISFDEEIEPEADLIIKPPPKFEKRITRFDNVDSMVESLGAFGPKAQQEIVRRIMSENDVVIENDQPALHAACSLDKTNLVEQLIKAGVDVNAKDEKGNTPLHIACSYGRTDLVEQLLEAGADLNVQDEGNDTPLHIALKIGNSDLIKKIVNKGAKLDLQNKKGEIPLQLAWQSVNFPMSTLLLTQGASPTSQWSNGSSLLNEAVLNNLDPLIQIIVTLKCNLNIQNDTGESSLHLAVRNGKKLLADYIIQNNTDPNVFKAVGNDGRTPLHLACEYCDEDLAILIFQKCAEDDTPGNDGRSLLHIACERGFKDLVANILDADQKTLNLKNNYKNTPLHRALICGHEDVAKLLIEKGADASAINEKVQLPIHIACEKGFMDVVAQLLAQANANNMELIDKQDSDGHTPLLLALKKGELRCAALLIQNGAKCESEEYGEYAEIITSIKAENESPVSSPEFIKIACQEYESSYKTFEMFFNKIHEDLSKGRMVELEAKRNKGMDETELALHESANKKKFEKLKREREKIGTDFKAMLSEINGNVKKSNFSKELRSLQRSYLSSLVEVRKFYLEEFDELLSDELSLPRVVPFRDLMNIQNETYINEQVQILEQQCNNSPVVLAKMLEKERLKIQEEMEIFQKMMIYEFPSHLLSGTTKDGLYLGEGVCYGFAIAHARAAGREKIQAKSGEKNEGTKDTSHSSTAPLAEARFLQAAYLLNKRLGNSEHNELPKSLQEKLEINIESTKTISEQSVIDFIDHIETLIPKLHTERSPNFILVMDQPSDSKEELHSSHAIYCHLSPPYEIRDANQPDFSLKTEDLQQFKMYLLFYFLEMAPRRYQTIKDLKQVLPYP